MDYTVFPLVNIAGVYYKNPTCGVYQRATFMIKVRLEVRCLIESSEGRGRC